MKNTLAVLFLTALSIVVAEAHPHMSLVSKLEIEYDGTECRGFWVDWTFDPYFSASIIQDYDKNGNRRFDEAETKAVFSGAFSNLGKYGYFTYLRSEKTRRNPEKVERFAAEIRGDRLAYRFFIRVEKKGDLNVAIVDTTYFCAVQYPAQGAATVKQLKAGATSPTIGRFVDKKYPVYYDPSQSATDNSKHTKWKPGLETVYPEEIRANF